MFWGLSCLVCVTDLPIAGTCLSPPVYLAFTFHVASVRLLVLIVSTPSLLLYFSGDAGCGRGIATPVWARWYRDKIARRRQKSQSWRLRGEIGFSSRYPHGGNSSICSFASHCYFKLKFFTCCQEKTRGNRWRCVHNDDKTSNAQ